MAINQRGGIMRKTAFILSVTASVACGGGEDASIRLSPFHGSWRYLSGEYHMRCDDGMNTDIVLTDKLIGLVFNPDFPNKLSSVYMSPCDRDGLGLDKAWTIEGAKATVKTRCASAAYFVDGSLTLSSGTLTLSVSEEYLFARCPATRVGQLIKHSDNPGDATL